VKARYGYFAVHPSHRRPTTAVASFLEWLRHEAAQDSWEPPPVATKLKAPR
jgi:LysR family glycine cleavage system transcriptional activator